MVVTLCNDSRSRHFYGSKHLQLATVSIMSFKFWSGAVNTALDFLIPLNKHCIAFSI